MSDLCNRIFGLSTESRLCEWNVMGLMRVQINDTGWWYRLRVYEGSKLLEEREIMYGHGDEGLKRARAISTAITTFMHYLDRGEA